MKNNDFIKVENRDGKIVFINLSKVQDIYPDKNRIDYPIYNDTEQVATYLTPESMKLLVDYINDKAVDLTEQGRIQEKIKGYCNDALYHSNIQDYSSSINSYTKAIELDPSAILYNKRGFVYEKKKEYSKAIADYTQAIELNPNLTEAYHNRGTVYDNVGEHEKAKADFEKENNTIKP